MMKWNLFLALVLLVSVELAMGQGSFPTLDVRQHLRSTMDALAESQGGAGGDGGGLLWGAGGGGLPFHSIAGTFQVVPTICNSPPIVHTFVKE